MHNFSVGKPIETPTGTKMHFLTLALIWHAMHIHFSSLARLHRASNTLCTCSSLQWHSSENCSNGTWGTHVTPMQNVSDFASNQNVDWYTNQTRTHLIPMQWHASDIAWISRRKMPTSSCWNWIVPGPHWWARIWIWHHNHRLPWRRCPNRREAK